MDLIMHVVHCAVHSPANPLALVYSAVCAGNAGDLTQHRYLRAKQFNYNFSHYICVSYFMPFTFAQFEVNCSKYLHFTTLSHSQDCPRSGTRIHQSR
jgi:hypothetical protein